MEKNFICNLVWLIKLKICKNDRHVFLKVDTTEEGIEVNANSNSLRGDTKAMSCELTDGGGGGGVRVNLLIRDRGGALYSVRTCTGYMYI